MRRSTVGDSALKDVIDDPSGDATGWFLIVRDGPNNNLDTGHGTGDVYVLWRETRELAIEQLRLHQKQVSIGYGKPLREVSPSAFNTECNFGSYENGSFILINADHLSDEKAISYLKDQLIAAEDVQFPIPEDFVNVGHTFTDLYKCSGCTDKHDSAEVILGDKMLWCTLACFRKNPPKGWIKPEVAGLILERNGAEKSEELLEDKINELKEKLVVQEQREYELEDEFNDYRMNVEFSTEQMEDELRDSFEEARGSLVHELSKASTALTASSVALSTSDDKIRKLEIRNVELETMIDNSHLVTPVTGLAPIGKFCGNTCAVSTGICGSLTYGWGNLSPNGYWEYPCDLCANQEYPMAKLDNSQIISHDDLPDDVNNLITDAANKAVKKATKKAKKQASCSVCNKTLADQSGVTAHQKSTKCGVVMNMLMANKLLDTKPQPLMCKTETVQIKELDYKLGVMKLQVLQTAVRWISTAAAVTTIAYHIV